MRKSFKTFGLIFSALFALTVGMSILIVRPLALANSGSYPPFETPPHFVKYGGNPIIGPVGNGWERDRVYNPGVTIDNDNIFRMLYRAENGDVSGRIGYAWSADGFNFTRYSNNPVLVPSENYDNDGCEDPRLVKFGGTYYMTYTGDDEGGNDNTNVCLAKSTDLVNWTKLGETVQPARSWNAYQIKAGAIVPQKMGDYFYMFYMGENIPWRGKIGLARATDIDNVLTWEDFLDHPVMEPRPSDYFDNTGVEPGAAYVLENGILLIYNGWIPDPNSPDTYIHRTGWAIFSKDNLAMLLNRCDNYIIEEYVPNTSNKIAFSESICYRDGKWYIHYGMQDRWIGVAIYDTESPTAEGGWWDSNWARRRPITVSGHSPENHQIKIVTPSDIPKSDYSSIRFLENETTGLLPYWIERNEENYLNVAWVRRLENSDNTIWMYYGNPSASSAENGDNVFLFFDYFGGGSGGSDPLNHNKWGHSDTGVDVYQYVLRLEDYNNNEGKIEHGPDQNIQYLNTERTIEFRIKNASTWRGGLTLSGPGNFGVKKEYAEIFEHSDYQGTGSLEFFCDGEWSGTGLVLADKWYVGRVDMYGDNKFKARFYYGMPDYYRNLLWTSGEKTNNWNPNTDNDNYCDKYRLHVWDGGGNSSYYYDWFLVRKWAATEPSVTVGSEESLPGKPALYLPVNGSRTNDNTPYFEWIVGENANNHRLLVDNDPDFTSPEENVLLGGTDNSYQVTTPLPDDNYSWKVIAINVMGENPSDVWTFVVDTVLPAVSSTIPENNEIDVSVKQNVIVTFSETMDTSVTPIVQQTAGSSSVTYTFSGWSTTTDPNDTATWTHDNWGSEDSITLKVSNYRDLAGNSGGDYSWSFRTKKVGIFPPEILASYTLSTIDVDVYYDIKVEVRDNDNLSNDDEVWLKLYENSLSQGAPDNVQNHYTFKWIRGVGFGEVGPGASNEHLSVGACSAGKDNVTTDNWTFRVRLGENARPGGWNLWANAEDEAGRQDNREFTNKFAVNPYVPVPRARLESRPPFLENEWVKENSPVLEPDGSGFDSYAVYNPAVVYENGKFYLFYRAQTASGGTSRIGLATSTDGINFERRENAIIEPTEWYELGSGGGCEDSRVVKIENNYWMTYTAYDRATGEYMARLALARSENLETWEKVGVAFPGRRWTKSGVIVPEKINGKYYMYFEDTSGGGDLFYATSEDLLYWIVGGVAMERREGYFDALTIEPGPTPVILEDGILLIYNSLDKQLGQGGRMTTGWVMFSREDPTKIIARCEEPFLVPEFDWENSGQVPNCVFAEGLVQLENTWYLYYGGADKVVGLATAPVRERSVLWSVETRAEWAEGTWDNTIEIMELPNGIRLKEPDLRGWWSFDEGSGNVAHDSSVYGNNGTIYNASWGTRENDNVLDFNGSNSYVDIGDKPNLEGLPGLTINAWIYPRSKPQSGEIVKKDQVYLLRVNDGNSGKTAFIVWDSGGVKHDLTVPDTSFPNNQWTMINATWDGCMMRIYKDNAILLGTVGAPSDRLSFSNIKFFIGGEPGRNEWFNGLIDEVMIFSRALTENEIRGLYQQEWQPVSDLGSSGEWMSAWHDFGVTVRPENLEILASVGAGENARVAVEVSKNGGSVEDNLGWLLLENGSNAINLSTMPDCQYARVKFRLGTENMRHSPSIRSFTFNGKELRLMVSTDSASFAGDSSLTLKGTLIDLENEETRVWFQWRENGGTSWNETGKQPISWRIAFSDNISGLVENEVYEFRAAVEDLNSGENTTGLILTFIMDRTLPSTFRLLSPENNVVIPEPPTLDWEPSSDNESGLSQYEVWVNENNVENVPAENAHYTTPSLPKGTYQWYVIAVDCLGNRRVSENTFTFTIETPPEPFRLLSPHGSYMLENMVVLKWENSSSTAYPLDKYQVWINENNVDNVAAGYTYYMTPELPQGSYQWYVVAADNIGNKRVSENVFTFNIGTPPAYPYRRAYFDGFENGTLAGYIASGMEITSDALFGSYSARRTGFGIGYAYVSDVMLGMREENLSVIFTIEDTNSRPGIGFASQDGTWVYAVVDPPANRLRVERRVAGYSIFDVTPPEYQRNIWTERQENGYFIWGVEDTGVGTISVGTKYRLSLYFSRRSMCAIAVLEVLGGAENWRVRTVVDVTPEHPLFLSDGPAKFDNFRLDILDNWLYNWEPSTQPVLSPTPGTWDEKGAFNTAVSYWDNDNKFHMYYRGNEEPAPPDGPTDSHLGYATSPDGYNWTKYRAPVLQRRIDGGWSLEDPALLINDNGVHYLEYTDYPPTQSVMRTTTDFIHFGDKWTIHPDHKTTAIVDTEGSPLGPVYYNGQPYRFFTYMEPPDLMGFSNDLKNWTWRSGSYIGPSSETWSNYEEYPAGAWIMPDGNVLLATCMCTDEGYVGGSEATVGTAIYNGSQPWVLLRRATLPFVPDYYGNVKTGSADLAKDNRSWYDGPNFPGEFAMGPDNWLYLYYGGNDQYAGVARTRLAPEFEYRNLMLSQGIVDPGEPVMVSLVVRNVGNLDESENVMLYIDGELENSRIVALGRDNETTVEFTVTIDEGGVYAVRAGGMSSTLWVVPPMVVGTTPENDAKALVNEDVVVSFNKSMDASVIPTLTQTSGSLVTYTFSGWSADNTVVTWIHEDWQPDETITLTVSGYQDLTGNVGKNYTWSFTTVAALGKPTLISPVDGTTTADNTPLFKWECGDNADNHRLLVDNDLDFSSPEENVLLEATDNSYQVTTPLPDDNYSWKVIAINAYGETESSVWTFVIAPWTGAVTIELENLYKVSVDKDLRLYAGSKLVVKFYTYGTVYQAESVIENFVPPKTILENENVPHPSGLVPVEIVRLVLTTDDTANEISTIASFTATKSVLANRYLAVKLEYVKPGADKPALANEYLKIKTQYIKAPS